MVLELVSSQNAIGLQRFSPFQVDRVQTSAINLEELWSVWNYKHNKREETVSSMVAKTQFQHMFGQHQEKLQCVLCVLKLTCLVSIMEYNVQVLRQGEFISGQCQYWAFVRYAVLRTTFLFLSAPPDFPAFNFLSLHKIVFIKRTYKTIRELPLGHNNMIPLHGMQWGK